jgi:glycosyltransferase involved in cell wall biosynthesis
MTHLTVENTCTAIIKTFERPQKLLALVESVRQYYPKLPIVIVDDSKEKLEHDWDDLTVYKHVAYDVGLAEGRNIGVRAVKTPHTILLDDDFYFTENTKIEKFLDILETQAFDLVAGDVIDYGTQTRLFRGDFEIKENKLYLKYKVGHSQKGQYLAFDFVINFFLTRTELLLRSPWDKELKIREHEDFFIRLKKNGGRVTYTPDVSIFHFPDMEGEGSNDMYQTMRHDRLVHFHKLACIKIGVQDIISDASIYAGPLGLFKIYSVWVGWFKTSDSVLAKCSWFIWRVLRPVKRTLYHLWLKNVR